MGRNGPAPTHWLRANEREWTPAHCVFVDTETRTENLGDDELLVLRCWVARFVDRRPRNKCKAEDFYRDGFEAADLADDIDDWAGRRKSTWVFTHNLGFDLTVTRLLDLMVERGWALTMWSTAGQFPWFRLARDGHTLALTDSVSWLQKGLEEVGELVGVAKRPLPRENDRLDIWLRRCRTDVEILARAMVDLMAWWEAQHLGNWTITGNGCGWNAMRHRTPSRTVLVRTGDGGRDLERRGLYGGRRDATRWGECAGGPFVTVDFEDAYPTIAAHLRLPAQRLAPFQSLDLDDPVFGPGVLEVMAEVEVEVTSPRYPLKAERAVWYPVGRFRTVLAHPEIMEARERGELRSVGPGFKYRVDGHLAGWARWVMDLHHGKIAGAPPVASLPAKRWGRSVIGRFAQRVGEPRHIGPAESLGWTSVAGWDVTSDTPGQLIDLCGERYWVTADQDSDDSFPAVLAWVESHCRVRLNRILDEVGEACWVSANTDGAVLDLARVPGGPPGGRRRVARDLHAIGAAAALCDRLAGLTWPLVPRPKDTYAQAWVAGPQTMILDGRPVLSGVPKAAERTDDGMRVAHLWPGIAWQMANGDRRGFVRPLARYSVPAVTTHRLALDGGGLLPLVAGSDGLSITASIAWGSGQVPGRSFRLAGEQSRAVGRLLAGSDATLG